MERAAGSPVLPVTPMPWLPLSICHLDQVSQGSFVHPAVAKRCDQWNDGTAKARDFLHLSSYSKGLVRRVL